MASMQSSKDKLHMQIIVTAQIPSVNKESIETTEGIHRVLYDQTLLS